MYGSNPVTDGYSHVGIIDGPMLSAFVPAAD